MFKHLISSIKNSNEYTKDVVSKNVLNAVRARTLKIEEKELSTLLNIINSSIDESFLKSIKSVEDSLELELKKQEKVPTKVSKKK